VEFDEDFGLPYIPIVSPTSAFYQHLPPIYRRNIWIVSIQDIEPITPTEVYEAIHHHLETNEPVLSIIISKRKPSSRTNLLKLRATFDQVQQYPKKIANYAVTNPSRPITPKHIKDFDKTGLYSPLSSWRCAIGCQHTALGCESSCQGSRKRHIWSLLSSLRQWLYDGEGIRLQGILCCHRGDWFLPTTSSGFVKRIPIMSSHRQKQFMSSKASTQYKEQNRQASNGVIRSHHYFVLWEWRKMQQITQCGLVKEEKIPSSFSLKPMISCSLWVASNSTST